MASASEDVAATEKAVAAEPRAEAQAAVQEIAAPPPSLAQQSLVEFIGTFFFVFTISMTVLKPNDAGPLAPLAIGSALMVMIFAGGYISGGHYNPAVSLAVLLRGRATPVQWGVYVVVQALGALVAAGAAMLIKGVPEAAPARPSLTNALLAEFLFTFALCYVVLHVATAKGTTGNSFYGLAIGFTVMIGAYAVGPVTGGAFNPAVALALFVNSIISVTNLIIYWVAQFVAAAVAAGVFRFLNPADR